jgi:hypothetical protein
MHVVFKARPHPWWWSPWMICEAFGEAATVREVEDERRGESHHVMGEL